jgi:glutaredoxin 3
MAKVVVYTKDPCPYCVRAMRLLDDKGVAYEEIDLTERPDEINRIKTETGWMTVPIILIDGKLVGGYNDLRALDDDGKLDAMLKGG